MSGLLQRIAQQKGSVVPLAGGGGFWPGARKDIEVRLVGIETAEDGRQYYGSGDKFIDCVSVDFKLQLVNDPESPDPNVPRTFGTKRVENYKLVVKDDLPGDAPEWATNSVDINAGTVAKMLNAALGQPLDTPMEFGEIVASLDYVSKALDEGAAPPTLLVSTVEKTNKTKNGEERVNRYLYVNDLVDNPIG